MKFKLDMEGLADDFFDETRIIGIVAPVKDYQLCWQLNHRLRFDFRINNEIEIELNRKQRTYYFSVFEYREPTNSLVHYLYNNQHDGEYLLPEFRHLDFIWMLKGDTVDEQMLAELMQAIRNIPGIQLVVELSNAKIKNKGHLIF